MKEDGEQLYLDPEWQKGIEEERENRERYDIGKKISEGEVYKVPTISYGEGVKDLLGKMNVDISSKGMVIHNPYATYAELEPGVTDFRDMKSVKIVQIGENTVEIEYTL